MATPSRLLRSGRTPALLAPTLMLSPSTPPRDFLLTVTGTPSFAGHLDSTHHQATPRPAVEGRTIVTHLTHCLAGMSVGCASDVTALCEGRSSTTIASCASSRTAAAAPLSSRERHSVKMRIRGVPVRYSVAASATRPTMAKRPFQISASALQNPPLLASALSPCSSGTSDATDSTAAVAANQASPDPLPACERRPSPRDASTASAETKPTMARRPLIRSGAGPLNANASRSLPWSYLVLGPDDQRASVRRERSDRGPGGEGASTSAGGKGAEGGHSRGRHCTETRGGFGARCKTELRVGAEGRIYRRSSERARDQVVHGRAGGHVGDGVPACSLVPLARYVGGGGRRSGEAAGVDAQVAVQEKRRKTPRLG
ncbi:hypothetical protein EJB05_15401, partial [Eragrostis curvula]